MGLRVIAIDGGEEKRKLCMALGAEQWIDYTQSKDIVADVKKLTNGRGAHCAVVTTASVRFLIHLRVLTRSLTRIFSVIGLHPGYRLPPRQRPLDGCWIARKSHPRRFHLLHRL